jgi:fatty acid amide hydrolase 2
MAVDAYVRESQLSSEELLKEKPLLGVPFTFKECISVSGMPYTAGLVKRVGTVGEEDATIVRNMRQAGGIPLCGTNCSEACTWFETYNNVYGMTNNPHNLDHSTGGSSGGEGAIVASAGSVLGIGTDAGGSVRMPAFCNGLFSHKPSAGVVCCQRTWPLSDGPCSYMITAGTLCRYPEDLPLAMDTMVGNSLSDVNSFTYLSQRVDLSSLKVISIPDDGGSKASTVHPEIRDAQSRVQQHLKEEFQATVETVSVPALKNAFDLWNDISSEDTGPKAKEILANCEGSISPFWELGKWTFGQSKLTFPAIIQTVMDAFSGPPKIGEDNAEAHRQRDELKQELEELMGDNGVLLYPTMPNPAFKHHRSIFHPFDFLYCAIVNVLKLPSTTVPIGTSREGLPLGIQIVAKEGNDHVTMAVAMAIHRTLSDCSWSCPPLFPLATKEGT